MTAKSRRQLRLRALPPMALAAWWLSAAPAIACSVCYGSAANPSPLITSARLGVFLLLAITVAVLGGFARFFLILSRRARQAEADTIAAEWAQLQRSSTL